VVRGNTPSEIGARRAIETEKHLLTTLKSLIRTLLVGLVGTEAACCGIARGQTVDPASIPESEYVTVHNGQLHVNGQRQRYWAAIGKLFSSSEIKPDDSAAVRAQKIQIARASTDKLLERFSELGFNAFRLWTAVPNTENYVVGDGSSADDVDYFLAQAKKRGFKVWVAGLNRTGTVTPADVGVIDDPATAEQWSDAVREMSQKTDAKGVKGPSPWGLSNNIARFWDPRLEKLAIERMKAVAVHTNKHTGLRWCDDPVFGVWELSNEEWWMRKMVGGQWQKLPPFFRNALVAKWNAFLLQKYGDDAKLLAAWTNMLEGESLEKGSILLLPMAGKSAAATSLNDSNQQAIDSLKGVQQTYERSDFPSQRGADVLEFFVGLHVAHKQREASALKPLGRSLTLSPMIFDTGIGYEIQSQFLHQQADAVAHDAYVNGWGPELEGELAKVDAAPTEPKKLRATQDAERISANEGRWVNWLLKPPGISQGVPWLEHNRVEGKPYLVYETQIQQPAKYRADFPLRIAALASIQDWDWICWHYFGGPNDLTVENPFEKQMDVTSGAHPQGYHFTYDAVQNATMRAASIMWRSFALDPARSPTRFIYGRKSLYDPASMDYAGSYGISGLDMLYTTYQHGVRIRIDPTRPDDVVEGPVVRFADRNTHNPYTPTPQITFDWKKGYLSFDAPGALAWTGMLANHTGDVKFTNGVTLSNVSIQNDPGMFDPITDDKKYIAFSLATHDGKPLAETKKATLVLVSTSFNTDFKLRLEPGKLSNAGTLPVLTARVAATVNAKGLEGMRYRFLDWNLKEIGTGVVAGGELKIPSDQPIFLTELTR